MTVEALSYGSPTHLHRLLRNMRPMVRERYPVWEDSIRFWAVKDLGEEEGRDRISQLDANVRQLFEELNSTVPR